MEPLLNPQRAQENLDADLAKIRTKMRMRLGIVAGVVIVGLFQTNFDFAFDIPSYFRAALPVLGLAVAGVLVVVALTLRDTKKARDRFESQRFRIPKRKS
jgi:hypothetical protein